MQKVCRQCQNQFEITAEDLAFYDKISPIFNGKKYLMPPPVLCPDCRQQRRLAFRNERYMYRRKCDFTGKDIISMYAPDTPFKVYGQEAWWSDEWDPLKYGREFDFTRPFFEQFRELQLQVPRVALVNKQSQNSEYTNHSGKNRNCYMSAVTFGSEDIYYSDFVMEHAIDCVDCSYIFKGCQLCYEIYYAWASYKALYCDFIRNCSDVWFCYDCFNVKNSFMCWNLRNKEYCIRNKQCSKEEYEKEMKKIFPLTYQKLRELRNEYIKTKEEIAIHPAVYQVQAENSSGDLLFETKNCFYSYDCIKVEDSRYVYDGMQLRDSMDLYHAGLPGELMYECHAISNGYNLKFCHFCYDNSNLQYCDCCHNSKNLFGCVSLKHNEYCILNKQYSKEEYEKLIPRIIAHMGGTGRAEAASKANAIGAVGYQSSEGELKNKEYGEFFAIQLAPFAYNQSRAQEYYPLAKAQAKQKNIRWSDYETPIPEIKKHVNAAKVPATINQTNDDILEVAILCEVTGRPFKIIRQELAFYRKMNLPIPRRHPDQRYLDRMARRPPRKLYPRNCAKCQAPIQTTYAPGRPEIVYCEKCYLEAVY